MSILQHFEPARTHLDDRNAFLAAVSKWLRKHPDLIEAWQWYCEDKRTTGPYLDLSKLEVGLYEVAAGYHGICRHTGPVDACADFIYREAMRVIKGR